MAMACDDREAAAVKVHKPWRISACQRFVGIRVLWIQALPDIATR